MAESGYRRNGTWADFRVYRQTGKVTLGTEPCMLMTDEEIVLDYAGSGLLEYLLRTAKT